MTKTQGGFTLHVEPGSFTDSEILVMLGENGTGKTTFIRMLAVRWVLILFYFILFLCIHHKKEQICGYIMWECPPSIYLILFLMLALSCSRTCIIK